MGSDFPVTSLQVSLVLVVNSRQGMDVLRIVLSWVLVFSGFEWCLHYRNVCMSLYVQVGIHVMCLVIGNFRQFVVLRANCSQLQKLQLLFCYWNTEGLLSVFVIRYILLDLILNQHRNTLLKAVSLLSTWNWTVSYCTFGMSVLGMLYKTCCLNTWCLFIRKREFKK